MKYNYTVCQNFEACQIGGSACGEMRRDEHPSDMRPGPHGSPVVASAVAGVEFEGNEVLGHSVYSYHHGIPLGWKTPASNWTKNIDWIKWLFCPSCGLRLPTADELQLMYERWMAEQDGRDGNA